MNSNLFEHLALNESILRALSQEGYQEPTDIQREAIPEALAGKDLLATAQTGTGKTAAFSLPMLHMLHAQPPRNGRHIRALILTPTRELALQIDESLRTYGRHLSLRSTVILGGVAAQPQISALRKIPDIVVATPGRLLDLHNKKHLRLDQVEVLVLDEADRMLDMGFVRDVRRIVATLPKKRQTLFFSATMSGEIADLASAMLKDPVRIEITPAASISENIEQKVLFVEQTNKRALLTNILRDKSIPRALVFTRTKHRANRIAKQLATSGISADAIHSNKSQGARQRALADFDRGRVKVLVATDIVARGIDVDGISHVINYELPNEPESYVHRIGRTARAGAVGTALSFCDAEEVSLLRGIEQLTKSQLTAFEDHSFHSTAIAATRDTATGKGGGRSNNKRSSGSSAQPNGRRTNSSSAQPNGRRTNSSSTQPNGRRTNSSSTQPNGRRTNGSSAQPNGRHTNGDSAPSGNKHQQESAPVSSGNKHQQESAPVSGNRPQREKAPVSGNHRPQETTPPSGNREQSKSANARQNETRSNWGRPRQNGRPSR
ncbi:MAG: DEAD/DEAH box helicase [Candidatus Latescibacterota bacterium]|jgi:ATP-dependent RNA helicase RhlE